MVALRGLLLLIGVLGSAGADAAVTFFSSRTQFEESVPDAVTENFEAAKIGPGSQGVLDSPLTWESENAFFERGDIRFGVVFQDSPGPNSGGLIVVGPGFTGIPSKAVGSRAGSDALDVRFPDGVPAVAMDVFAIDGGFVTATIVGQGGELLGTRSFNAAPHFPGFVGVSSDRTPITRITLKALGTDLEVVDDVSFVPEPSPFVGLAAAAVAGLLAHGRRRWAGSR